MDNDLAKNLAGRQCDDGALADLADALGNVRASDGAPRVMTFDEVLERIHELRDERCDCKVPPGSTEPE